MKYLVVLLWLVLGVGILHAQEATAEPTQWEHNPATVETITLDTAGAAPLLHITGSFGEDCGTPILTQAERQGLVLFVEVYREIVPTLVACAAVITPFEIEAEVPALLELDADFTLPEYLVVNEQGFRVEIAVIEPVGTPPAVPPMTLIPLVREAVTLTEVNFGLDAADSTQLAAYVTGEFANGCEAPALYHLDAVEATDTLYNLEVFRLLEPDLGCTMMLQPFEAQFPLHLPYLGAYAFVVNGEEYFHLAAGTPRTNPTPASSGATVLHTITSAEVVIAESFPPQYFLSVAGYQNDGCTYPVEVTQAVEGNTIRVTIFRTLPIDVMCSMQIIEYTDSIPLAGDFTKGTYTVIINDTVTTNFEAQ